MLASRSEWSALAISDRRRRLADEVAVGGPSELVERSGVQNPDSQRGWNMFGFLIVTERPGGEAPVSLDVRGPSIALRLVRFAYQRRFLTHGHGRPFELIPKVVWGGESVRVQTDIGPLVVSTRDRATRTILIFGRLLHEEAETRLLRALLKPAKRVVDIGASVGWYSVLAAAAMQGRGLVYAFEPNPTVLPYLRANAELKGVHVSGSALSDRQGPIGFFCAASSNLSSSVRRVGPETIVSAQRLDDLDFGGPVDFVKLDVEGGELAVLRGGRRFRERFPHAIWMIEADEELLADAGESLAALDVELNFPAAGVRLYTVVSNRWQQISGFTDMKGAYHKNVLVVPDAAGLRVSDLD